jgi:outer membrane protein
MHLLPTVNLQGQGNFTSNTSGFVSQPFFGSIAIQASVPIFDGGNTYGLIDEANAKVKGELLKMRQLEEQVASQVRGNVDDIVLKRDSVETSKNVAELAKANQENAERLFELGAATQLDVADANLGAFQANLDQARSELDLQVSRLGLAYTIGQFRPVDSTVPAALSSDDEHKARSRADGIKD